MEKVHLFIFPTFLFLVWYVLVFIISFYRKANFLIKKIIEKEKVDRISNVISSVVLFSIIYLFIKCVCVNNLVLIDEKVNVIAVI